MCIRAGQRQETYTLYYINTSQASSVSALPALCVRNSLSLSLSPFHLYRQSLSVQALSPRPTGAMHCTTFPERQMCAARKECIDTAARKLYRRESTRTNLYGATHRTRKMSPALTFGACLPIEIEKERPLTLSRPRLCPFSYNVEKRFFGLQRDAGILRNLVA